jgi:hypothetical protein
LPLTNRDPKLPTMSLTPLVFAQKFTAQINFSRYLDFACFIYQTLNFEQLAKMPRFCSIYGCHNTGFLKKNISSHR